ncbi:uncharacterized protein LAESUDRAFT_768485 [Laetiporus sulphureus 93-53]|uniref:Roadblock/LAMTOR2 domain-containing protein n=1 Tax=Laetiporus sulphureus 93-53 TaxID=1314785 RepID=A0A165F8T8_9APHY|nr:uncharacterized protein LAESUDRAFT_768485 [Laetiporus sulphureus 93-53]KZT08606.1 hypothetical protein LAESUDRAFT_768485 [Laetiporus sulphureus 93-53]
MLNLANLRNLLSQVLALPHLHTAILFTPQGHLVSYAAGEDEPKDRVRVIVGLGGEIWRETQEQGIGYVDSELGRLLVMSVDPQNGGEENADPVLLLALNADDAISWNELEMKARELAKYLEQPVSSMRDRLAASPSVAPRPERAPR